MAQDKAQAPARETRLVVVRPKERGQHPGMMGRPSCRRFEPNHPLHADFTMELYVGDELPNWVEEVTPTSPAPATGRSDGPAENQLSSVAAASELGKSVL